MKKQQSKIMPIVDLGSNTIRLSIYQIEANTISLLFNKKTMAGLAGYVNNGSMSEKGVELAIDTLKEYKRIVDTFQVGDMVVFATASLRNVKNSQQVVSEIEQAVGVSIDLISGKEEARLDFVGVTQLLDVKEGLIVDIGGGSTELVVYQNNEIISSTSIPIGSLSLWHRFVKEIVPSEKEIKQMKAFIKHELLKNNEVQSGTYPTLCGVGGTIRAMRKINNDFFDLNKNNNEMELENVKNILDLYLNFDSHITKQILRLAPERINSFIPGLLILRMIGKYYGCERIVVSDYGVREGYLKDRFMKEEWGNEGDHA
ncbi:MAG: hypothetical protein ACRDBX_05675 [Erysipelotrichaceae bacterium]